MRGELITCDVCGKTRSSDSNGWWLGYRVKLGDTLIAGGLLYPFSARALNAGLSHAADLCGEQHAIEWVSSTLKGE